MNKAYLVAEGYDEYFTIIGGFSSKEKLDKFLINNPSCYSIIIDLDKKEDLVTIPVFCCEMRLHSGRIINHYEGRFTTNANEKPDLICRLFYNNTALEIKSVFVISTVSLDHAKQSAKEAREMYLQNNKKWDNEKMDIKIEDKLYEGTERREE